MTSRPNSPPLRRFWPIAGRPLTLANIRGPWRPSGSVAACGMFAVVCITIAMAGIRILRHVHLDERAMLVVGVPIIFSFFSTLAPQAWVKSLPDMLQYLLGSSVTLGAMAAMVLNLILPRTAGDRAARKSESSV